MKKRKDSHKERKKKTYSNVHEGNIALKNIVIFGFAVIKIPK